MLTEDYGVIVGYSHLLPLMLARALQRPYALCAQSIGPIRYLRRFLRPILREAAFVTVRERISSKEVAEIEPKAHLSVTADLAFLLQPCSEKRLRALLEEQGLSQKQQTRIGVSASALLATKFAKTHSKSYVEFMAELCDEIGDSFDAEVILIPHVFGPRAGSDDRETILQIVSRSRYKITAITTTYRPEEIKAIIGTCDIFFGARMHANIAALSSNVPTLAVAYSHKSLGIMSLYKLDEFVLPVEELSITHTLARLKYLIDNQEAIKAPMTSTTEKLGKDAQRNIGMIQSALIDNC
jgi:polysaccharide pyruvyl transferase WcaK-like protein